MAAPIIPTVPRPADDFTRWGRVVGNSDLPAVVMLPQSHDGDLPGARRSAALGLFIRLKIAQNGGGEFADLTPSVPLVSILVHGSTMDERGYPCPRRAIPEKFGGKA